LTFGGDFLWAAILAVCVFVNNVSAQTAITTHSRDGGGLLIERPARTWEFLCAVGKRAAYLEMNRASGGVVYPLKAAADFM